MKNWKQAFEKDKELVLVTASVDCRPNANIVVSLGFVDDKILIADCQMKTTIENLKENSNVCVVSGYFKIKGTAEIFSSGRYFDLCSKNVKDYPIKNAILVKIKEVYDLNDAKKLL